MFRIVPDLQERKTLDCFMVDQPGRVIVVFCLAQGGSGVQHRQADQTVLRLFLG